MIGGGGAPVRPILYMTAISAIRTNPVIRTFDTRLVARGQTQTGCPGRRQA